jgi:hypothetical protein
MSTKLDANQTLKGAYVDADSAFQMKQVNSLINFSYDYVAVTYPEVDEEVYTFKTGGSGGTTVGTITVVYTDSTKESISSVARS